ncbi:GntR family transcriptional regulator [Microbacterium dextranolyticum]|uniref:HTH gntR-type domain-containing protein n=1 Tax=Microbacterium dextranolyticum TaxID=36806 RepID=A0A9W6M5E9_9MICO|nr:GntR family transcriptional regulator [Microbacterium dextranolyticum]MBM7461586.1 DNA-binding GntR family transcriptional regulator [Microbacterium dextranolyticum]GLJ94771.1 hypothetical protein GCM10017591_08330 [Microbacterium dextranolyticum]
MSDALHPIDLVGGMILSDEVYARIGAAIVDGTLRPGQRLRDVEIARQLGVSRTPVREALQRLERFGLVEIAVGRYTRVTAPDDKLRRDTGELAAYFLGNALHLALSRCDDATLARIVAAADAAIAGVQADDSRAVFTAAVELGISVTLATENNVFLALVRESSVATRRNLGGWSGILAPREQRERTWRRMRDCIAARDGDGAEQTVRDLYGMTAGARLGDGSAATEPDSM